MATTTPNFGWPVPTSTDLVKNGAVAIEALGDAVDASLLDLKGGTTGQVLAKATNTDMDFAWVAADDTNAIQNAIVNAKGDLIGASANDTPAIISVGQNGETLVADSSTATGLRYTAGTVQSNPVLNSAFQVWQRSTSVSVPASTGITYTADRFWTSTGANQAVTISRQLTSDTTNLPNIQYCARYQRNSGQTGTGALQLTQPLESINSIPFAGKTITFSFYARKGADFSAASSALNVFGMTGTGTDQNGYGAYTGAVGFVDAIATLTTTWQRFTYTATLATNTNEILIQTKYTPVGTAGTNDYYEVTGVQIDIGSVALPFRTYAGTIQGETSACQRYYWRAGGDAAFQRYSNGFGSSTTLSIQDVILPVTMRAIPTSMDFSTLMLYDGVTGTAVTSAVINTQSRNVVAVNASVASGLTQFRPYELIANNSTSSFIGFSAEL